jgi:phosphoribosylaminoimidazolecarboxamide formyltransferase / IMP cyclohydrolase
LILFKIIEQQWDFLFLGFVCLCFIYKMLMESVKIKNALISVFDKNGLDSLVKQMQENEIRIFSTGGTLDYIQALGVDVESVESLTSYPAILDGRVKTLHPKIFGGILSTTSEDHLSQLDAYGIPKIDLVVVDLYPFEDTVKSTEDENAIIEKIDIGGISLIRAAAKNHSDVLIIPSRNEYSELAKILGEQQAVTNKEQRRRLALKAFDVSSHYDAAIFNWLASKTGHSNGQKFSTSDQINLRYGENPHQKAVFYGKLSDNIEIRSGKELSYNNLLDVDAAVGLMREFKDDNPCFAILKHTNPCGVAIRQNISSAWKAALAGDPVSAFGGVLIANRLIDMDTARLIDAIFYEILIAPDFDDEALEFLCAKKNRRIIKIHNFESSKTHYRSIFNGVIAQDRDLLTHKKDDWTHPTNQKASSVQLKDLEFANKCVKHLKSNAIALVKDEQLIGIGCGQTSRVDALNQAIHKAESFKLELKGAVMASDAFFPFPDCVEIAHKAGIKAVIHPGGSVKDQDSIDFCDRAGMSMVITGVRHFRH